MSQDAESAIEVTDVDSAAAAIEKRWETAEQPETEDVQETETAEVEETDVEEVETDEVETEDETEDLSESDESEPETEEGEALQFESVNELAEAMGITPDEFLANIKLTRKIDGVEEEVTLAELRDGNQRHADYTRKTTELAENRKAFEAEAEKAKQYLEQQFQEAAEITATLEAQLLDDYQSIDWNALELEDREEWLVQRQKYGEKAQQIQAIKAQTQQKLAERQQEQKAKQQQAYESMLAEQNNLLISAIPEWSDTSVRESEAKEMSAFLGEYGFSESEVGQVIDHRLVKLARDAMKNKGKTTQIDTAKKKVKKLPKLIKPGATTDKVAVQKQKRAEAQKRLKKNGESIDSLAAHLESFL